MATTTPALLTVEDLHAMPDLRAGHHELHHGELIIVPPPASRHHKIQDKLRDLLKGGAGAAFHATTELGFYPLPRHEYRVTDVAAVSIERWNAVDPDEILSGSPELVIEVLSPSNTASEMLDKQQTCMRGGCREFWIADPRRNTVTVFSSDAPQRWYGAGESIPLALFGAAAIAVDDIFNA